ncbi:SDR family oxidoreductase [Bradyrhizobium uaiense]|uniref:SDR family oxidoreductase n=1 Tax=Bradyrhizobium uaiense TaxID=2594946 RepID=A0A6P1BLU7_9BRAD|nr:SDR family oxidoreductase [Bradyrhizobium uaiense]NEU99183.1 SDR family oxidoreductase [Bradyrhizobium uaiense]
MKIVIIGGTGLIGSKTADRLRKQGHEVIAGAPSTGVNTITGEGLAETLKGAEVVIDLANSPSFEDKAVLEFFQISGRNLTAAEKTAGVKHHVALSIIGTDRLPDSGYLRAKVVQEMIVRESGVPYTIVRSTQFFEFLGGIAQEGTIGDTARLSTGFLQPIASDDVADFVTDAALSAPVNGIIEISGPDRMRLCDFAARYLKAIGDTRTVVGDPDARYFGTKLQDGSLVADNNPRIGRIGFDQWFATSVRR